ncbi:FecR family protein [Steroidobacter flavus]|uniref:FecR family protein n=1 Tax=Steroidobacter flavus TaxID=1842136 RepID=A0ABV8SQ71_9GAMM
MTQKFVALAVSDEAIRRVTQERSGTATPADHAAIRAWRAADPEHELAFQEAEDIWDIATGLELDPKSGLLHVAQPLSPVVPVAKQPLSAQFMALAATVVLAVGLSVWLTFVPSTPWADFTAATGEVRDVTLADGSRVSLNANASMDVDLSAGRRRVELRSGKAFFQVARDAGRTFEVDAGNTTVTVLGTAFEIDRRDDGSVTVSVSEHAVAVQSSERERVTLREGESVRIDANGALEPVSTMAISRIAAWREGRLVAEPQSLGEVADALSHYHRGWIVVDDDVAQLSVNAVLDLTKPMDSLRMLSAAVPIRVRTITPYLIVISTPD